MPLLCHCLVAAGKVVEIGEPERAMGASCLRSGSVGFRGKYGVNKRMPGVERSSLVI